MRRPRYLDDGLTPEDRRREYERRRGARRREVRAKSWNPKRVSLSTLREGRVFLDLVGAPDPSERPRTRAECADGHRPCPFVGCKWHLYLDVLSTGSIKFNFPDLEPDELEESCALDVADRGSTTFDEVGAIMNITRERVRQIWVAARMKIERQLHAQSVGTL